MLPLVFGICGTDLSDDERAFFKAADPWGIVLFERNCEAPDQIRKLIENIRFAVGRQAPVFIDQEGGRVQRLRGPSWRDIPAPAEFSSLFHYDRDAARRAVYLNNQLIANDLANLGITGNFTPVIDLFFPETHAAIASRTFGGAVHSVSELGRQVCEAHLQQGILPVLKHIPGQGRAATDSHEEMPFVNAGRDQLRASDFGPFSRLKGMPAAMVAHVIYRSTDPNVPATLSQSIIEGVIRDDIAMKALSGPMSERAAQTLDAGCDVALFCTPELVEMEKIASKVGAFRADSVGRADDALSRLTKPMLLDEEGLTAELATLLTPRP